MLTRRVVLTGAAALLATPAIVRAASSMPVRGIIVPVDPVHMGFLDRLRFYREYGVHLPRVVTVEMIRRYRQIGQVMRAAQAG